MNVFEMPKPKSEKEVSYEQNGDTLSVTAVGKTFDVTGTFKGPDLTTFDGVSPEGEPVQVVFSKTEDNQMEVDRVIVSNETVFPSELAEAA